MAQGMRVPSVVWTMHVPEAKTICKFAYFMQTKRAIGIFISWLLLRFMVVTTVRRLCLAKKVRAGYARVARSFLVSLGKKRSGEETFFEVVDVRR